MVDVITIDGPVASGKGSVSTGVAKALGFHVLDSGALYRLTALAALNAKMDLKDQDAVGELARGLDIAFRDGAIYLSGADVTQAIRAEQVGVTASQVAVYPSVRMALFDLQRNAAKAPGLVADGRDMGSVVFPEAKLKVFLTASAEARALRRFNQLKDKGISSNIHDLAADLRERDRRDTERALAPLAPAPGARVLDSSDLTLEQTVSLVLDWYRESRS